MKTIKLALLLLLPFIKVAYAEPNGTCWGQPPNNFFIEFSANFTSNTKGAKAKFNWTTPSGQSVYYVYCAPNPEQLYMKWAKIPWFIPADGSTGHLTKDIDMTATIPGIADVPLANGNIGTGGIPPIDGGPNPQGLNYGATGSGTMTLTQDILGGAIEIPPNIYVLGMYRSVYSGVYASETVVNIITEGQFIPVPQICNINNNVALSVAFPNIEASQLTTDGRSATIKSTQVLNYKCSSSLTQDINVQFAGTPASFSVGALKTSNDNLGVVMLFNGEPVPPGGHFDSKLVNGTGGDSVTFVPVKSSTATEEQLEGEFNASATLIITSA